MFQRSKQGVIDVIGADEPLTRDHVEQLQETVRECLTEGQPRAVFDLQQVPLIDSAGLEALLDARDEFERRGGALKLAAPSSLCQEILSITGVACQFETYGEVKAAIGSFLQ